MQRSWSIQAYVCISLQWKAKLYVVLQESHWENGKTSWEYLGCSFEQRDTSLSATHVKI